ncbi:MAG: sulfurtransferase [Desulfotalea sp.]|nr:MAG: sulfurtransferase [Desulfotalea sp.]
MIITDWIHSLAGFFILLSLSLGVEASPIFQSSYWLLFTTFVGLNLFQFGITKFCPMGFILKKIGVAEQRRK